MEDRDPFFVALVGACYAGRMAARVTLQIGGMVITGKLISERTYFEGIRDIFAREGTHGTTLFANAMESWPKGRTPTSEELETISVFFMEDAVAYVGNQPGLWLGWWRGRVSAVVGWAWEDPQVIDIEDPTVPTEES